MTKVHYMKEEFKLPDVEVISQNFLVAYAAFCERKRQFITPLDIDKVLGKSYLKSGWRDFLDLPAGMWANESPTTFDIEIYARPIGKSCGPYWKCSTKSPNRWVFVGDDSPRGPGVW